LHSQFPPSDGVGGAEDGVVDPHVVGQVGHVVAFALAVGVVLHAVERLVVQAHLIVAVAHQYLGDGSRHELRDGGGCRQLRGDCGGQQGKRAGGEGIEIFAVDLGVEHMASRAEGASSPALKKLFILSSPAPHSRFLKMFSRLTRRAKIWLMAGSLVWVKGGCLRRGGGRLGDPALLGGPLRRHPVHLGTLRACRFPARATDLKWMICHTHFQTSRTGCARENLRDFLRFSVTLCSNG
jgi:hypothetical protein